MNNLFSIDLEEWYHYEYLMNAASRQKKLLPLCIPPLLDLFRKRDVKITFFTLADEAESQPEIIDMILEQGHEIASHGYDHTQLTNMTKEQFHADIKKSKKILKTVAGIVPKGYRAPYFSLSKRQPWVFDILKKEGFSYDSSLFPTKTPLYGEPDSPLAPYRPSSEHMFKHDPKSALVEFPASVSTRFLVKRIPFLGGFYMRSLPYPVIRTLLRDINTQGRPGVMYFHPWEAYKKIPRLSRMSTFEKFVTYHGNRTFFSKLDSLLKDFQWTTYNKAAKSFK